MKVKTIIGAEAAYVCIQDEHRSLDVKLRGGCSAAKSLAKTVGEMRATADRLLEEASFIESAIPLIQ